MPKRGSGDGSIYELPDGRWRAALSLGFREGKRIRKVFTAKTRGQVRQQLTRAQRDHSFNLPVAPDRQTVAQFLERWLEGSAKQTLRPRTFVGYQQLVRDHLMPGLGNVSLVRLTPAHVQRFITDKLASDLSPRTVQYIHAVLRRALNQALKWGIIYRNPATLIDSVTVRRAEVQPLLPEQARKFLDAVQGQRHEALYSVALAIGLRQGEALGLQWSDIDLDRGTLTVRHGLQRIAGKLTLVEPKSARSRRTVSLPDIAVEALKIHRTRQHAERIHMGSAWKGAGDYVFTTSVGTPLDPRRLLAHFQRTLALLGIPKHRFHDLRHSTASFLLAQGVNPRTVADILGHSQISLTLDTYSHILPAVMQDATRRMDAILRPQPVPLATQVATKAPATRPN